MELDGRFEEEDDVGTEELLVPLTLTLEAELVKLCGIEYVEVL